jgi:hypothetical protein
MKLKLVTGVIALCIAATGVLIGALPASAYDGYCNAGDYCIWEDAYYNFGFYDTPGVLADYTKAKFGNTLHILNDRVSSYCNRGINSGPTVVYSYRDVWYAGGALWRAPLGQCSAWVGATNNDKASSHLWYYI